MQFYIEYSAVHDTLTEGAHILLIATSAASHVVLTATLPERGLILDLHQGLMTSQPNPVQAGIPIFAEM